MVNPRKVKETITEQGSFLGINFPEFKGVVVELTSTKDIVKSVKTGEVLEESSPNFRIKLKFSGYNESREDQELSFKIQEVTQLKFPPYYRSGGYYSFYTNDYQTQLQKIEIYKNLIDTVSEYVKEKKDELVVFKEDFEDDYVNSFTLETSSMLLMPYHVKNFKPMFLVVLKSKISSEDYSYLKRESYYSGYLSPIKEEDDMQGVSASFYNVQQYFPTFKRKNGFFLIPPSSYSIVKTFLQSENAKEVFYYEEQIKKSEKIDVKAAEYQENNIFGVSIKYLEDKGVYLFNGKGYKDSVSSPVMGRAGTFLVKGERTIIGLWANNLIYAEKINNNNNPESLVKSDDFFIENSRKIELDFLPGGSAKDGYYVPLSNYNKLLLIKENVERENKIWGREQVLIDIFKESAFDLVWNENYPVVLIEDSGVAYFCHTSRKKKNKDKNILECTTFKGIEISQNEANYFLKEHPFSNKIYKLSKDVSILASSFVKEYGDLHKISENEKNEIFETLLLHLNLKQDTELLDNKKNTGKKVKF